MRFPPHKATSIIPALDNDHLVLEHGDLSPVICLLFKAHFGVDLRFEVVPEGPLLGHVLFDVSEGDKFSRDLDPVGHVLPLLGELVNGSGELGGRISGA